MSEISALAVIIAVVVLVIGPGGGIYVGTKAAISVLSKDIEKMLAELAQMNSHLKELNHRTTKSEAHIEGLERREDE